MRELINKLVKDVHKLFCEVERLKKIIVSLQNNRVISINNLEVNSTGEVELNFTDNNGQQLISTTDLGKFVIKYNKLNYTHLVQTLNPNIYEYAYVREEQGIKWLPGNLGGNYYPSGLYMFDGVNWVHDKSSIFEQFNNMLTTVSFYEIIITDNILPINFPVQNLQYLMIDVDNMISDIDITNYLPNGLREGCLVRIRKIDDSPYKLIFTDNTNTYNFIDMKSEYFTFHKINNNLKIN